MSSDECFVIMPFGGYFDTYYRRIYRPAIEDAGYVPRRADEAIRPGAVMDDIYERTREADVYLADVSGLNVNVMFELGLAHSLGKPIVLLTDDINASIPFDLNGLRIINYNTRNPDWAKELESQIREVLGQANSGRMGRQPLHEELFESREVSHENLLARFDKEKPRWFFATHLNPDAFVPGESSHPDTYFTKMETLSADVVKYRRILGLHSKREFAVQRRQSIKWIEEHVKRVTNPHYEVRCLELEFPSMDVAIGYDKKENYAIVSYPKFNLDERGSLITDTRTVSQMKEYFDYLWRIAHCVEELSAPKAAPKRQSRSRQARNKSEP